MISTIGLSFLIVLSLSISHRFKQNSKQNVDSVHFSQNVIISDKSLLFLQGVDIDKVIAAGQYISKALGRPSNSKVAAAKSNL